VWGVGGKDLEGCGGARKASGEVGVVECVRVGGWHAFSVWGRERGRFVLSMGRMGLVEVLREEGEERAQVKTREKEQVGCS
jgi:hypothetical protein